MYLNYDLRYGILNTDVISDKKRKRCADYERQKSIYTRIVYR